MRHELGKHRRKSRKIVQNKLKLQHHQNCSSAGNPTLAPDTRLRRPMLVDRVWRHLPNSGVGLLLWALRSLHRFCIFSLIFLKHVCVLHTVLPLGIYALFISRCFNIFLATRGSSKIVNSPNRGFGIKPRDFTHGTYPH